MKASSASSCTNPKVAAFQIVLRNVAPYHLVCEAAKSSQDEIPLLSGGCKVLTIGALTLACDSTILQTVWKSP